MSKYSKYIPPSVVSKLKYSNDDELLKETKKLYLTEIENKRGGKKFIDIMASKYNIDKGDIVDTLSTVLKLSEVYYYLSYLFTAIQSKEIGIFNSYLFSWEDIPGNDSRTLIDFLKQNFYIDWIKTPKIEKIDDGKTIRVFTEKNSLSLCLNDEKTKVYLKIDDDRTDEFIVKTENGKLNIYFNSKKAIATHSEIFNDFGQPIWIEELNDSPKLWNVIKEDDNDHIFLSYIHMGSEHTYFDPITHVFKRYNETAVINYRLHFDDGIIEISAKNSNQKAIEVSLADVLRIFKLSDIKFKDITNSDFRKFDVAVEKVTYERREGDEASASMTRANNESDTRKDPLRNDLNDREFRKENGLLILENGVKSIVGLSSGERGKIQIRSHLSPENQIKMFHKIKDIVGW